MTEFSISPTQNALRGTIRVPADKSITHRALMLTPLVHGESQIENYLDSETTRATLNCLRAMGADIQEIDAHTLRVNGRGLHSLQEPRDVLDCLGSGTTMRLLSGICAGQHFLSVLDGTPALKRRPMGRIIEPLKQMGATILARDNDRFAPLVLRGGNLRGIEYAQPVASAQVKSAILFAGLFADTPTTIHEPAPSRDHSERMLRALGVDVSSFTLFGPSRLTEHSIRITPPASLRLPTSNFQLPNDFSSAAFFVVAALLVKNSQLVLENVGLNPGRTGLLDALTRMGAEFVIENQREENGEPLGDLVVSTADLRATHVSGAEIPRMIDEFPIFALAATQAHGETCVRDAQELRVKESDRVASVAQELRKLGAQIEEHEDGFTILGPTRLHGARVNAHNDHRLAMSLAIAALIAEGETIVEGWESVADSFPNFPSLMLQVAGPKSQEPSHRACPELVEGAQGASNLGSATCNLQPATWNL
ncbi:MAG: 3-phosphoshikimate 1-carboxyvinyltransferase [Chloroflexi bacterium]|nr:3-phosphoshikimate 1-carboxyvinyltransferase [Chloroflexota bacterium]